MKLNKKHLAGLLLFLSFYTGGALLAAAAGLDASSGAAVLAAPGFFLYKSFLWAGLYVPLFFAGCFYILMAPTFRQRLLFSLAASVLPFLTLALALRVIWDSQPAALSRIFILAFGRTGSAVVLLLLTVIGGFLIQRLGEYFFGDEAEAVSEGEEPAAGQAVVSREDPRQSWDTGAEFVISSDAFAPAEPLEQPGKGAEEEAEEEAEEDAEEIPREILEPPVADPGEMEFLSGMADSAGEGPGAAIGAVESDSPGAEEEIARRLDALADQLDDALEMPGAEFQEDPGEETEEDNEVTEEDSEDDVEEDDGPLQASKLPPAEERDWAHYQVPVTGLLQHNSDGSHQEIDEETRRSAQVLEETLEEFKIKAEVTGISKGPVITMFELLPSPGVKLSKITGLADNIALRLAASRVRIVAPIPGKHAVGIEVPNKNRELVSFREMIESPAFQDEKHTIPIILGKDIGGETQVIDLTKTPHLLIAGATGSGKSVCVNSLISSILYEKSPEEVRLMLVDPKIVELKFYNDIPHLLTPVITDPKRAFQALQYCLCEMERRYSLLDAMGVRDIESYNQKIKRKKIATTKLPYIVVVVDEFADLMAVSGKELEGILARLAAMSRAVGIHLVLATQRPSIDVITGLIKANFPSRIAFMVASKTDSRIILDNMGAEKLLGKGDMLFTSAWNPFPSRMQGAFLSEDEVENIVEHVKTLGEPDYIDDEIFIEEDEEDDFELSYSDADPLYNKALEIVLQAGKASASYLQRRMKIGYNRAARLVEDMEDRGIVGPPKGSKPREVVHVPESYREPVEAAADSED